MSLTGETRSFGLPEVRLTSGWLQIRGFLRLFVLSRGHVAAREVLGVALLGTALLALLLALLAGELSLKPAVENADRRTAHFRRRFGFLAALRTIANLPLAGSASRLGGRRLVVVRGVLRAAIGAQLDAPALTVGQREECGRAVLGHVGAFLRDRHARPLKLRPGVPPRPRAWQ
jgi:hypothetical protein